MNRVFLGTDANPHRNLAREEALLLGLSEDEAILYLWQNANTVVIGRNQNAWRECRTTLLEEESVILARRTTGGGAVYHDLGNLNFSFIVPRTAYDLAKQLGVVRDAVRAFGVDCAIEGRNDLLSAGRKLSGNAFRHTKTHSLHHGTLLVDTDMAKMARYLEVSPEKLAAKGVKSVPARVVNLNTLGKVNVKSLTAALVEAFQAAYGNAEIMGEPTPDGWEALAERNASWDWNFGATPAFDMELSTRLPIGQITLGLSVREGRVTGATVYTDAMEVELAPALREALRGAAFTPASLATRARPVNVAVADWLFGQNF